jgi:low molecular weight protein-tyrosine phosphatase
MINHILIICTGNICRSPMAEALLAHEAGRLNSSAIISSAGLNALIDSPAHPMAQKLLKNKNIDLSQHRARQATPKILLAADLILTMESWQVKKIQNDLPSLYGRVDRLGKWGEYDIFDPFQKGQDSFSRVFELIERGVKDWQVRIWNSVLNV